MKLPTDRPPTGRQPGRLTRQSAKGLTVKLGGAGLSLVMLATLAAVMDPNQFGRFGFGISLATLLSVVGGLGQRLVVIRFIPAFTSDDEHERAREVTHLGYQAVAAVSLLIGLVVVVVTHFTLTTEKGYLFASAALIPLMALTDYQAGVLRAQGSVLRAHAPRDALWRIALIAICLPGLLHVRVFGWSGQLTAEWAMWAAVVTMAALMVIQYFTHPGIHRKPGLFTPVAPQDTWRGTSIGLWITSIAQTGFPHLSIVVLGFVISPEQSGGFFAAMRIAAFFNMPLLAVSIPTAPVIARHWHTGNLKEMQRVCAVAVAGSTAASLAAYIVVIFSGRWLLGILGPAFVDAYPILLILSGGYVLNVAFGLSADIMTMTGSERPFLLTITATNLVAIAAVYLGTPVFGEVFAASAVALSIALWNVTVVVWSRRNLGVDPTILGAIPVLLRRWQRVKPST